MHKVYQQLAKQIYSTIVIVSCSLKARRLPNSRIIRKCTTASCYLVQHSIFMTNNFFLYLYTSISYIHINNFCQAIRILTRKSSQLFQLLEKHRFLPVAGFNADDLKSRLGLKKKRNSGIPRKQSLQNMKKMSISFFMCISNIYGKLNNSFEITQHKNKTVYQYFTILEILICFCEIFCTTGRVIFYLAANSFLIGYAKVKYPLLISLLHL